MFLDFWDVYFLGYSSVGVFWREEEKIIGLVLKVSLR